MRHEPRNAAIAVRKRMHVIEAVMGRSDSDYARARTLRIGTISPRNIP